jgi:cell division protein FtsQ
MLAKLNIGKISKWLFGILMLIASITLIIFSGNTFSAKRCKEIIISIKNGNDQLFVSKESIEKLATQYGSDNLKGRLFSNINFHEIEERVLKNKQIKTCQVYKDVQGNLKIEVEQHIPIARIMNSDGLTDQYVDAEGIFFPLSEQFSARVTILSGNYFRTLASLKGTQHEDLLNFIKFVFEDDFLKAQFTQLDVDANKNINIVPLLGNHIIEFGEPQNIEQKLKKLKIFYKEILPVKGWNTYSHISIRYNGQIVCK